MVLFSRSLRNQFVSGVADVETQRKLLEVECDFNACIKIALAVEVASKELVSSNLLLLVYTLLSTTNPKRNLIVLKSIRVKHRINGLMFVAFDIKITKLQRFASNVFGKRNPKVINLFVNNMFNGSGTAAPLLVNVKIYIKIVTMESDSGASTK